MNMMRNLLDGKYVETWGASASGGSQWATTSLVFVPIPDTRINFILKKEELVRFEGRVLEVSDGQGNVYGDLGIQMDDVNYTGDQYPTEVPMGVKQIEHKILREFRLIGGAHRAQLVFRRRESSPGFVMIYMSALRPAELEAGY